MFIDPVILPPDNGKNPAVKLILPASFAVRPPTERTIFLLSNLSLPSGVAITLTLVSPFDAINCI